MKEYRLCVVIVNYKTSPLVKDCVNSLKQQLDFKEDCIVIVDNCSGGNEIEYMENWLAGEPESIFLIKSEINGGFSHGNNLGIKAVEASFYFLTNSDTVIHNSAVDHLLEAAEKNPEAGLIGPRLSGSDGMVQVSAFNYPRPLSELIDSAGNRIVFRLFQKYIIPRQPVETLDKSDWISFASVLIKKEVFDHIGLMDEGYFMYYEDVDFCHRASLAGYDCIVLPTAQVVHLVGQSSGLDDKKKTSKRLPPYYYHSRSRYYRKFHGTMGLWIANLLWCAGRPQSLIAQYFFNRKKDIPRYKFFDIWKCDWNVKIERVKKRRLSYDR